MKTKNFTKKLSLKKSTIADFNVSQMKKIHAGEDITDPTCGLSCPSCMTQQYCKSKCVCLLTPGC